MLQHSKERVMLIDKLDKRFKATVARIEREFFETVKDFYEQELASEGNAVKKSTRNFAKLNKIEKLSKDFARKEGSRITKQVAVGFTQLVQINEDYFGGIKFVSTGLQKRVKKDLLARYGITVKGRTIKIIAGGWLHGLTDLKDPFRRVQEVGIRAVSRGIKLSDFKKQIRDATFDGGARTIKNHFRTNANDAYAQFDRTTQTTYADELGLRAFIYEGGLIDTSRPFCEDRNGLVFTTEEAEAWDLLTWKGKNKDYDPLRDMGGYNCRHHPSFISDELAIILRPDLKDKLK